MELRQFQKRISAILNGKNELQVPNESEIGILAAISEQSNSWNKLALLVSIEDEKTPSKRKTLTNIVGFNAKRHGIRVFSTNQWNQIALDGTVEKTP